MPKRLSLSPVKFQTQVMAAFRQIFVNAGHMVQVVGHQVKMAVIIQIGIGCTVG